MDTTPTQRLATLLLEQPVAQYVEKHRANGTSWRLIARQLNKDTEGQIDVTAETIRGWFKTPAAVA